MTTAKFFYKLDGKWVRCSEPKCLQMAELGCEVRKIVYGEIAEKIKGESKPSGVSLKTWMQSLYQKYGK